MDSSIATDPRFKLLGRSLNVNWKEAVGACFLLWLACYERRSKCFRKDEADIAAELDGFADALLRVGLASPGNAPDVVIVHGVEKRIEFLEKQAKKGAVGGKRSGKSRASRPKPMPANPEASASGAAQAEPEANGSGSAQAYSPAPDLDLAPDPSASQAPPSGAKREESDTAEPTPKRTRPARRTPPSAGGREASASGAAQAGREADASTRLPFSAKDLGQALQRGAGDAFALNSWDSRLATPVTAVIRSLAEAGRTLADVEAAGRVLKGWRISEPLTWGWVARAGNLTGAVAKAMSGAPRAEPSARGQFEEWK